MQVIHLEGEPVGDLDGLEGCFGYVGGDLYLAHSHHASIINDLITSGRFAWDQLINAPQAWGWYFIYSDWTSSGGEYDNPENPLNGDLQFSSDDATITPGLEGQVQDAFSIAYPDVKNWIIGHGTVRTEDYGERARKQYQTPGSPTRQGANEEVKLPNGVKVEVIDGYFSRDNIHPSGCFGFVGDTLYLGTTHHAKIIYELIEQGTHDWESLMNAKQKWGWFITTYPDSKIEVRYTTDEAKQTKDPEFSQLVAESIGAYFHKEGIIDQNVGEGYTNADEYGERSKAQYFGEREYCEYCEEYYNPQEEEHDHSVECQDCADYYDPEDWYQSQEHNKPYCPDCAEHVDDLEEHNDEVHFQKEPWMPHEDSNINWQGQEYRVYSTSSNGLTLVKLLPGGMIPSQPMSNAVHLTWDQYKASLVKYDPQSIHPDQMQMPLSRVARISDLHDDRVFAKIALDYINSQQDNQQEGAMHPAIGSKWIDDLGQIHTVTSVEPGMFNTMQVNYTLSDGTGHLLGNGSMSLSGWGYYMKPLPTNQTPVAPQTEKVYPEDDPNDSDYQVDSLLQKDDPAMLAIERNPKSAEWRWSYDGGQLHIWRVLNRFQHGPSHYDMFGHTGYGEHSQGRVYVSPMGQVGVLYWQITHPECEAVLNEWVEKTFNKMPDSVYRAYGPYQGYAVSRWDFPIVDPVGLPISKSRRWWENPSARPDSWYYENGMLPPSKKQKSYPAQKAFQKTYVPGPTDDAGSPVNPQKTRGKKQRKRNRNRKYRNRKHR